MSSALASTTVSTTIAFDRDLHKRAKKLSKRARKSFAALCNDGLRYQVRLIENQIEEDKQRERRFESENRTERRLRALGESSPLAPEPLRTEDDVKPSVDAHRTRVSSLYKKHAQAIVAAFDDPNERRLRAMEAVRAIQEATPLTHPGEDQVREVLEALVVEMRMKATSAPATAAPAAAAQQQPPTAPPADPVQSLSTFLQRSTAFEQKSKLSDGKFDAIIQRFKKPADDGDAED